MFDDTLAQTAAGPVVCGLASSDGRKRLLAVSGKISQRAHRHELVSCIEENSLNLPIVLLVRRTIKVLI